MNTGPALTTVPCVGMPSNSVQGKLAGLPLGSCVKLSLALLGGDLTGLHSLIRAQAAPGTTASHSCVCVGDSVLRRQGGGAGTESVWLPKPEELMEKGSRPLV